ncbi:MAG: hypothetical protein ABSB26_06300 [Nitrososphaerales archaeon]
MANKKREKMGGSVIGAPSVKDKMSDSKFYGGGIEGITPEEEGKLWDEAQRIVKEKEMRRKAGKTTADNPSLKNDDQDAGEEGQDSIKENSSVDQISPRRNKSSTHTSDL